MKRIKLVLIFMCALLLVGCGEKKPSISVYNWGDYIDEEVLKEFEKEYGIRVIYDTFATNEDLYTKVAKGGANYDLIFPSDYMIERMIREDLLEKIDLSRLENYSKINQEFKGLDYDPEEEYSVPYWWGTVGIVYDKNKVDGDVGSWDILWDPKYEDEIIMLNSQRDSLGVSLIRQGFSMNTRDENELELAKEDLLKQKKLVYAYMGDEVKDVMIGGEASLALVWSGDAVAIIRENPNMAYSLPKEGTNIWYDSMVIPKGGENIDGAYKFIDFMLRPDIAARNADYVGYSIVIDEAIDLLPEDVKNSYVAYPSKEELDEIKVLEVFKDPKEFLSVYDKIWTDILSAPVE